MCHQRREDQAFNVHRLEVVPACCGLVVMLGSKTRSLLLCPLPRRAKRKSATQSSFFLGGSRMYILSWRKVVSVSRDYLGLGVGDGRCRIFFPMWRDSFHWLTPVPNVHVFLFLNGGWWWKACTAGFWLAHRCTLYLLRWWAFRASWILTDIQVRVPTGHRTFIDCKDSEGNHSEARPLWYMFFTWEC